MSVSVFNRCWARVILETLLRQGVSHFCIAPGSRSTPLTLEAVRLQQQQRANCHTHFDERGLGFLALGIAKASKRPVAVIVTSGTAAANLYPAVVEARQTGINLILLTADRPPELIECGANQAILQQNMFAEYPVANVNLPRPSEDYQPTWLISVLEQACYQQQLQGGVVHLNVPFAEPLYGAKEEEVTHHTWLSNIQNWLNQPQSWVSHQASQQEVITHPQWDHWRTQRGIVIVGRLPNEQSAGIATWANSLGWILLTDIQSGVESSLPYADIWLANQTVRQQLLQADIVIQFGSGLISKRINQFLAEFKQQYWIVEHSHKQLDPHHHSHTRFYAKPHHWIRAHAPLRQKTWLLEPLAIANFCTSFIEKNIGHNLNEASLAHYLERILPNKGLLFLGNSLFVRLVDALAKLPEGYPVYTNRGASGIDGLLATVAGLGIGSQLPVVAMIGDLSALYDLNSLALFRKVNQPIIIFVLNNNGGAIFDLLPVDNEIKEQYYRMPHHLDFSQFAASFDLKYARPYTWADLGTVLKQAYLRRETTIIEIKVGQTDATRIYKHLIEKIGYAVVGG